MIDINNMSVELGGTTIFKNLSFSIENGVIVILGLNGSGKTSLLKAIGGLIKLKDGVIKIDNRNINLLKRRDISKIIAFLPQEYTINFSYTVKEMLLMGRSPHIADFKFPSLYDYEIAEKYAYEVGITHLMEKYFMQLSGGEKKLVLISMVLTQETEYILLDEPTAFLDLYNSMKVIEIIRKLSSNYNKKLIISMHDVNQTLLFADKILILKREAIPKYGNIYEIITKENLNELYHMDLEIISENNKIKYILPRNI